MCQGRAPGGFCPALLAGLAVGLAASLPFLSTLHGYFLSDDFGLIQLLSQKPTLHVLSLFTSPWTEAIYGIRADELRPTLALSYQLDSLRGAASPFGYHLTSLGLHVANALLVCAIARQVASVALPAAVFAGVLFAVLPIHAETVIWISGRADSIPALFYLAAFLAWARWRRRAGVRRPTPDGSPLETPGTASARRRLYAASLAALFLALFSKQSAITLVAMLGMYDLLVERRPIRPSRAWLRPYLPFVGLTLGYLGLRYALFGNAVREQQVTLQTFETFAVRQATYLKMLAVGSSRLWAEWVTPELALAGRVAAWSALAIGLLLVLAEARRVARGRSRAGSLRGRLLFFGPVWWLIGIVPLAVTYESPRHLYLASAGLTVGAAILLQAVWDSGRPARRTASIIAAASLVLGAALALEPPIEEWKLAARVSEQIARDLEREVAAAPPGSLFLLGAPAVGASPERHAWIWMWAAPFVFRPPFMPSDLTERALLVEAPDIYCCPSDQWFARSRANLAAWTSRPNSPPVFALRWDPASGALTRQTEATLPWLRDRTFELAAATTPTELCELLDSILGTIGPACAG